MMECVETPPATGIIAKKSRGIQDFFATVPKTSAAKDAGQDCKSKNKVCADTMSNVENENGTSCEESDRIQNKKSCLETGKNMEDCVTVTSSSDTKKHSAQQCSNASTTSPAEPRKAKTSMGTKKKSLTTKKTKSKADTVVEDSDSGHTEQKNSIGLEEAKSVPQEIDYQEFLKKFISAKSTEKSDNCTEKQTQATDNETVQGSSESDQNCLMQPSDGKSQSIKTHKISKKESGVENPDTTKSKTRNTSNAFSVLMQSKFDNSKGNSADKANDAEGTDKNVPEENSHDFEIDLEKDENKTAENTPSILNFFSKGKKSKADECNGGGPVLVMADVHLNPAEQKTKASKQKTKKFNFSLKRKEKTTLAEPQVDNEIVFLGSETIEAEEFTDVKNVDEKSDDSDTCLKSAEISPKTTECKTICDKSDHIDSTKRVAFLQSSYCPQDHSTKRTQATLQFGHSGKLSMNTSELANSAKTSSKKTLKKTEESEETTQGKNIRSRKRKKLVIVDSNDSDHDASNKDNGEGPAENTENNTTVTKKSTRLRKAKNPSGETESNQIVPVIISNDLLSTGDNSIPKALSLSKKSRKRRRCSITSELSDASLPNGTRNRSEKNATPCTTEDESGGKDVVFVEDHSEEGHADGIEDQPDEKHEPTTKDQNKRSTANTKCQSEDAPSSGDLSSEQGTRRQSRRLAEQQKIKDAAEKENIISVVSDDSSEEEPTPGKKRTKTKDASSRISSLKQSPKKAVGKLAPIFTKRGEAEEKAPQKPPEDPEVVRRRREFLLSGVPSELKRQAASCDDQAVTVSDFVPFPLHSHIQQQCSVEPGNLHVWSLASPETRFRQKKEPVLGEIDASHLHWSSLQWQKVVPESARSLPSKSSLDPEVNSISPKIQEMLVKEMQQADPCFPFTALCDKFRAQLGARAINQPGTAGNHDKTVTKEMDVDSDIIIVDEAEDSSPVQTERDCQWPDSLQPKCASEVIGNESSVRRLKYWLEEWKALIQREAKISARSAGGANVDSDFELSGCDSEEEGSHLCNTMLLVGPHGVGKTAAVYALAHQLSFKVFEVNASSSRQGRQILSQLQEATQSHQVAQKKDGIILSAPQPATASPVQISRTKEQADGKKDSKKKASAVPKAFANFFRKADSVSDEGNKALVKKNSSKKNGCSKNEDAKGAKASLAKETTRKRRGAMKVEEATEKAPKIKRQRGQNGKAISIEAANGGSKEVDCSNLAGCLNLTSTSLILFDEVDLAFEEDVGFLQTIQHFISTTKIPIIMTTADPGFKRNFNARFEVLVFKAPPVRIVTSYLQTVCLANGIRTSREDISDLAGLYNGDVRRALLAVQFLILSRGGQVKEHLDIVLRPASDQTGPKKTVPNKQFTSASKLGSSVSANNSDSDGDFVSLKPVRKKCRRILDDDDDSNSKSLMAVSDLTNVAKDGGCEQTVGKEVINADQLPSVHLNLYHSIIAVPCQLHGMFTRSLKEEYSCSTLQQLIREHVKLKANKMGIAHTNTLQLLPLPKMCMPRCWNPLPSASVSLSVKRKRIRCDIYDSEGSNDESLQKFDPQNGKDSELLLKEASCSRVGSELGEKCESQGELLKAGENGMIEQSTNEQELMDVDVSHDVVRQNEESASKKSSETKPASQIAKHTLKGSKKCTDNGLGSKLLSSFANYYEFLSAVDSALCSRDDFQCPTVSNGFSLLPGIEGKEVKDEEMYLDGLRDEMAAEIDARSNRQLWQCVDKCVTAWKKDTDCDNVPEDCSIPVHSPYSSKLVIGIDQSISSVPESYSSVTKTVTKSLPLTTRINHDAIALDYLPVLRSISSAERCRQIAKTKRRFHHHFDSIGLCLNEATITALSSGFLTEQQSDLDRPSSKNI